MLPHPIEFVAPTARAWDGMKWILFRPFDLGKWFVLGFTAWLASLLDGGGGGSGNVHVDTNQSGGGGGIFESFFRENTALAIAIVLALLVIGITIFVVFLWLSSRGKFMFLDNVVHNRSEVKLPWDQFRVQGNSLFVWRLIFSLVLFAIILIPVGGALTFFLTNQVDVSVLILPLILCGSLLLVVVLAAAYIGILLEDFVVPLMYRDSLMTNEAWKRFLSLHGTATGQFVLYALWKFLLGLAAVLCIIVLGLGTCCIAFVAMAIPFIGTVVLLPMFVFFRILGPEFLRQFGSDYDIFTPAANVPEAIA